MPEVIKTIFVGDSSQITGEYRKLSAELQSYVRENQVSFKNSASGHAAEIRALKLEADGFRSLATSMREQAAMKEQAISLAQRSNISIQQALSLLHEEYQLRKNIATAAQAQAAASGAAAARAAAISNPRATGLPGGGGLAPLTPQSLQALERAAFQQKDLARQTFLAGQSGKNGALGFLAFSQAVEDAQYGVKGVLNNIPQMIMGFGGGAGVAGALSLAAVAAVVLYDNFKKLTGLEDLEKWEAARKKGVEAYTSTLKSNLAALKEVNEEEARTTANANYYQEEKAGLEKLFTVEKSRFDQLVAEAKLREEMRGYQDKILGEKEKAKNATPTDDIRSAGKREFDSASNDYLLTRERLLEDINAKQREAALIAEQYEQKINSTQAAENGYYQDRQKAIAAQESAREKIARQEAELAQSQEQLAGEKSKYTKAERKAEQENLASIQSRLEANKRELKDAESRMANLASLLQTAKELRDNSRKELVEKLAANKEEVAGMKRLIEANEELGKATAERIKIETKAREAEARQRENVEKFKAQMESEKSTGAARADYQAELIALQLQASGHADLAKSMREETALRKEAAELATAQGLSEEEALATARNRAALLKEIAAQEEKAALRAQKHPDWKPRSEYRGIRRAANGAGDFNSGNNLRDWSSGWNMGGPTRSNGRPIKSAEGGLRQEALRKRQQDRENAALRNSSDPNTRQLQQLVDVTTSLQEGLKKIGVIK